MITVDPRAGSEELIEPLRDRGHDVRVKRMPFGDVAFLGQGPEGRPVKVGIEVKKIGDFLSSVYTGRLGGYQLPGMLEHYDYCFILVQGRAKCGEDGEVLLHHKFAGWVEPAGGRSQYMAYVSMQMTLALLGNAMVIFSEDTEDSADLITAMFKWWTKKWTAHTTLKKKYRRQSVLSKVKAQ